MIRLTPNLISNDLEELTRSVLITNSTVEKLEESLSGMTNITDELELHNGYYYKTSAVFIEASDSKMACELEVNEGETYRYVGHIGGSAYYGVLLVNSHNAILDSYAKDGIGNYDEIFTIPANVTKIKLSWDTSYAYSLHTNRIINVIEKLDNISSSIEIRQNTVVCWGDSLTQGVGSGTSNPTETGYDNPYTVRLQGLLGVNYTVVNGGNGGDLTIDIAARQGGFMARVKPFTIPGNTALTPINVYSQSGEEFTRLGRNLPKTLEPVTIGGTTGYLMFYTIEGVEQRVYQRRDGGTNQVVLTRDEMIIPSGIQYKNSKVIIIWSGTNDGDLTDSDKFNSLINKQKSMIEFAGSDKWLVLGLLGNGRTSTNRNFAKIYGSKFVDIRSYLSAYGLSDSGLTPTQADLDAMENGYVPPQLFSDGTHLIAAGYDAVANCIYYQGKQLGYWS